MTTIPIPKDTALQLCQQIRQRNRGRWYTFGGLMCWGCARFSRGDMARMCVSGQPDFRGCLQVNVRFDKQAGAG